MEALPAVMCSRAFDCKAPKCTHKAPHSQRAMCADGHCSYVHAHVECLTNKEYIHGKQKKQSEPVHVCTAKSSTDQKLDLIINALEAVNDSLRNEALNVAIGKLKETKNDN